MRSFHGIALTAPLLGFIFSISLLTPPLARAVSPRVARTVSPTLGNFEYDSSMGTPFYWIYGDGGGPPQHPPAFSATYTTGRSGNSETMLDFRVRLHGFPTASQSFGDYTVNVFSNAVAAQHDYHANLPFASHDLAGNTCLLLDLLTL